MRCIHAAPVIRKTEKNKMNETQLQDKVINREILALASYWYTSRQKRKTY